MEQNSGKFEISFLGDEGGLERTIEVESNKIDVGHIEVPCFIVIKILVGQNFIDFIEGRQFRSVLHHGLQSWRNGRVGDLSYELDRKGVVCCKLLYLLGVEDLLTVSVVETDI